MSLGRTTLLLLPFQIVFRAGEALLPLLLAGWFGHDERTDLLIFAGAVFGFFGSLVFSLYQDSALITVLAEARAKAPQTIPALLGTLLFHTLVLGAVLAGAIGLGFGAFAQLRYAGETRTLALWMVPAFSAYLVALSVKTFLTALLTFSHRFVVQPVASGVGMAANLALIWVLKSRLGVAAVPCGMLVGELVACVGLSMALARTPLRIRLNRERPQSLTDVARLLFAEVGGSAITRVNPVVDQFMATLFVVAGAGTLLKYSSDVATIPSSLLSATLLPVLISHLSDTAAEGNFVAYRQTVKRTTLIVVGTLIALCGIFYVLRVPLCEFAFHRGAMDQAGARGIADILPFHLLGLPAFGALLVLARAHVALRNSGIMISMGLINATANAAFNLVLVRYLGAAGIALSTSCVSTVIAVIFALRLPGAYRRRVAMRV